MTFVVDSTVLLGHLRSEPGATEMFEGALDSGRRLTGSVLSRIALRRGARAPELPAIETVEILLDWVAVDHEIAAAAQDLATRHGRRLSTVDYVVAATAQRLGADLLTREPDRYPMFTDLQTDLRIPGA